MTKKVRRTRIVRLRGVKKRIVLKFLKRYLRVRTVVRFTLNFLAEQTKSNVLFDKYKLEKLFARRVKLDNLPEELREWAPIIRTKELDKILKLVPQMLVNGIVHEWVANFKSVIAWRKAGRKASLPSPFVKNSVSFHVDGPLLQVLDEAVQLKLGRLKLTIKTGQIPGSVKSVKITWFRTLDEIELGVNYETELNIDEAVDRPFTLAIDLGLNNFIAAISDNQDMPSFIVSGGWIESLDYWMNQKLKEYSSCEICQKRVKAYVKRRIRTTLHELTNRLIDLALKFQIGTIIIGKNVVDSLRNSKKFKTSNKALRKRLRSMPYRQFIELLKYKAEAVGIKVVELDESFTSKCSALTEQVGRKDTYNGVRKEGRFIDKVLKKHWNADINAALNMLKVYGALTLTTISKHLKFWLHKLASPLGFSFAKFLEWASTLCGWPIPKNL